jgi:thioredoxin-related protein/YHS domain-containing protein
MNNHTPRLVRDGFVALLALAMLGLIVDRPALASDDANKKINWREDLGSAQAEAKSRDLLLWIQFTGPWCINCRRMDRATFLHAGVVLRSRDHFVPVKLRSDEHEALAMSLGLTSLPSTVIVRPNGEVVEKYEGYIEPETFEATLAEVLRREGRSPEQLAAKAKKKDDAIALAGYCPVTLLREQKLVPGRTDLTHEHDGRIFRFASEEERKTFRTKPDSFAPANDGRCPVSQVDRGDFHPGDPHWGVVYDGHLFLFKNSAERDQFVKDPERYANIDLAERDFCPHRWSKMSLARRSPMRFSVALPLSNTPPPAPDRIEALLAPSTTIRR